MAFKDLRPNFGSAETIGRSGNCFLPGKSVGRNSIACIMLPE